MSEERLEEIKRTKYQIMEISKTNIQADFNYLLNYIDKQAERAQELESESYNAHLERLLDRKEQQNKRYREALEFYADKGTVYDRQMARKAMEEGDDE